MLNLLNNLATSAGGRRVLGLGSRGDLSQAHAYLASPWPSWFLAMVLALAAIYFGWCYLRDGTRPSWLVKTPLLALRLIAFCALLVMLMQPMLRLDRSDRIRSSVVLLVDDSESMGFKDPRLPGDRAARLTRALQASPVVLTRAQIAERLANTAPTTLVGELSKRYNVRLYRFASRPEPVSLPADSAQLAKFALRVKPDAQRGNSTQIGAALRRALDDSAGQRVAGALVITDGGNNLGDDPVAVAESAREQGVRVSTLGIGDPTPTRDIALTEVLTEQVVRKDNLVQVYVGVAHRGYQGRTISLALRRGDGVIGTRQLTLGPPSQKQMVAFSYTPSKEGSFAYTVSTDVLPDEVTGKNNKRSFLQRVISKKLRILYVEGEPRWEYRYLKNAVLRDNQIKFSCILTSSTARTGGEGNVPIFSFPADEKELFDFDILILGDVPRAYFSDVQMRNIRRFVEDKGGSLVMIAGENHMPREYSGSSLDALLPVTLEASAEQVKTPEPFQWELTQAGRRDPIMRLDEDPTTNERTWSTLPGMYWNYGVERAKPGATVLAVNPLRTNAYGKRILVAVQSFGAGRCFLSLVDSTWRWRWKVGDKYFYRYWGQVVRTLTPHEPPGGNLLVQVNADRAEYMLGDRVSLHARVLDAFYRPIKERQLTATVTGETGAPVKVTLNAVPGSPGLYATDFLAERTGKFDVDLVDPASPTAHGKATWLVESLALEQQQPEMNEPLLKRIAQSGGGAYYLPDELRKWIDSLKSNDLTVRSESEIELWDAPLFLLLFITPLALEWLIRKRTGLL